MNRLVIANKYFDSIENTLKLFNMNYIVVEEDWIFDETNEFYIPKLNNCILLAFGYDFYSKLKSLHDESIIHIGLRRFNYSMVADLPSLSIGTNKIIFGKFPRKNYEFFKEYDDENPEYIDSNIAYFFSKKVEDFGFELPEYDLINLDDDVISYIKKFDLIKEDLGFDYETNGFPLEYGSNNCIFSPEFSILGFSIVSNTYGLYVDVTSGKGSEDINLSGRPELKDFIINWLKSNSYRLWTYYCPFEINVTYHIWKEFVKFQDSRVLCICDDRKYSLKYNSQLYFGIPSWDDELDDQLNLLSQLFSDYPDPSLFIKEYKNNLWPDYEPFKLISSNESYYFSRFKKYYGNNWPCVDQKLLGKYCVMDSFYTLQIMYELIHRYENAYPVYLNNAYLGARLNQSGIKVNIEKRDILDDFYENLELNSKLWFNKLYIIMFLEKFKNEVSNIILTDRYKKLILLSKSIFTLEGYYFAKEFVSLIIDETKKDNLNYELMCDLLGEDLADEIYWISEYTQDLNSLTRKRKLYKDLAEQLMNYYNPSEFIKSINEVGLSKYKEMLLEYNKLIESKWSHDTLTLSKAKLILSYIDENWDYESTVADGIELTKSDYDYIKNAPDFIKELIRWYVTKDTYNLMLVSENFTQYIPSLFSMIFDEDNLPAKEFIDIVDKYKYKPTEAFTVDVFCRYIWMQNELPKYDGLDKVKLIEKPDKYPINKLIEMSDSIVNYNSNLDPIEFFELFKWYFRDDFMFLFALWNYFELNYDGDPNDMPNQYHIFKDNFYKNFDSIDHTNSYKALQDPELTIVNFEKKLFLNTTFVNAGFYFTKDETMKLNYEDRCHIIYKFQVLWGLWSVALKQRSTYIAALTNQVYKVTPLKNDKYVFHLNEAGDIFKTDFQVNMKTTKRWASGFHTFRQKDDIMSCLEAEDDYIFTYFDISQAEPRMIAYTSKDPVMMDLYNRDIDMYRELLKEAYTSMDPNEREEYRPLAKIVVLAVLYGRGDDSLVQDLGLNLSDVQALRYGFFGRFEVTSEFIKRKVEYCSTYGEIETFLGDRLVADSKRAHTVGINYYVQNGTSVLLCDGFENCNNGARVANVNITPVNVVHDSDANRLKTKDLFITDLVYRKYFRAYLNKKFGVNFAYDLEIAKNFRDKIKYNFNLETMEFSLKGYKDDVNKIISELTKYHDIFIISSEEETIDKDLLYDFSIDYASREHIICMHPLFHKTTKLKIKAKLNSSLGDISWYYKD